jgi:hypothetical protein
MSKVYCQSCKKYDFNNDVGDEVVQHPERCVVAVDDYLSPNHRVQMTPKELNKEGDCPYFESGK